MTSPRSRHARSAATVTSLALLVACGTGGCGSGNTDDGVPFQKAFQQPAVQPADNAEVMSQDASDRVTVGSAALTFPPSFSSLLNKKPGDILIGDRGGPGALVRNPRGFLRKVKSVAKDGDNIVVQTDDATLPEAFNNLSFQASFDTPALDVNGPVTAAVHLGAPPGVTVQGGGKPINVIDISGKSIFDYSDNIALDPGQNIGFHAFAKLSKGTLTFTPKWDIGADIKGFKVSGFHASATGTLDAEVEIQAGVDLTTNIDSDMFTKLLAKKIFKSASNVIADYPINMGSIKLGPLSIPLDAEFKATLNCDFAFGGGLDVTFGAKASASLTAGIKYENSKLVPSYSHTGGIEQTGPAWKADGLVRVKCSITPNFQIKLWNIAMAEVWATAYGSLGTQLTCGAQTPPKATVSGEAYGGVNAGVHAKVDILGFKVDKSCTLFSFESPHASFSRTFDLPAGPGGKMATCTGAMLPQPPEPPPMPDACFAEGTDTKAGCTHDECATGDPLGAQCNTCTSAVCKADPYCCNQYWGPSCFLTVEKVCGKKCP